MELDRIFFARPLLALITFDGSLRDLEHIGEDIGSLDQLVSRDTEDLILNLQ